MADGERIAQIVERAPEIFGAVGGQLFSALRSEYEGTGRNTSQAIAQIRLLIKIFRPVMSEEGQKEFDRDESFFDEMLKLKHLDKGWAGIRPWHAMDVGRRATLVQMQLQKLGEDLQAAVGDEGSKSKALRFLELTLPELEKIAVKILTNHN